MNNEFEVLSVHDINFVNPQGEVIIGTQLWIGNPTADPAWYGYEVGKIWFKEGHELRSTVQQLSHGDRVTIRFNRRGKPESIELAA